jgi:hypothetical protein
MGRKADDERASARLRVLRSPASCPNRAGHGYFTGGIGKLRPTPIEDTAASANAQPGQVDLTPATENLKAAEPAAFF